MKLEGQMGGRHRGARAVLTGKDHRGGRLRDRRRRRRHRLQV